MYFESNSQRIPRRILSQALVAPLGESLQRGGLPATNEKSNCNKLPLWDLQINTRHFVNLFCLLRSCLSLSLALLNESLSNERVSHVREAISIRKAFSAGVNIFEKFSFEEIADGLGSIDYATYRHC